MGRKSNNKKTHIASVELQAEYKNNTGIKEMKKVKFSGNPAIIASMLLATLREICIQAGAPYTEILSNEIKREVRDNALKNINVMDAQKRKDLKEVSKEMKEEEKNNGK